MAAYVEASHRTAKARQCYKSHSSGNAGRDTGEATQRHGVEQKRNARAKHRMDKLGEATAKHRKATARQRKAAICNGKAWMAILSKGEAWISIESQWRGEDPNGVA